MPQKDLVLTTRRLGIVKSCKFPFTGTPGFKFERPDDSDQFNF